MKSVVLTFLVLAVLFGSLYSMCRVVCKNHPCGCCCTDDVIPCCDKNFKKTQGTVASSVLDVEETIQDIAGVDEAEAQLLAHYTLDDRPFTEESFCDRFNCKQKDCPFSCSLNIEKASENGWICNCKRDVTVQHQVFLLLNDSKTVQCLNEGSFNNIHPLDRQAYVAQILTKCVAEGCSCQKSANYADIFKQQLDAYNEKLAAFTKNYLDQMEELDKTQKEMLEKDAKLLTESKSPTNQQYKEVARKLNALNTKLFDTREKEYNASKNVVRLEKKSIPATEAEIDFLRDKIDSQKFIYDSKRQQRNFLRNKVPFRLTDEQKQQLKEVEAFIKEYTTWTNDLAAKVVELAKLRAELITHKAAVTSYHNAVETTQKQIDKILATTRREAGAFDCYSYLIRYPEIASRFGCDCDAAWNHWVMYGVAGDLSPLYDSKLHQMLASFDCNYYMTTYRVPLLFTAAKTCDGACKHYVTIGISKGYVPHSPFDCYSFFGRNADLREKLGDNCKEAEAYWKANGIKEGRSAVYDKELNFRWSQFDCYSYLAKNKDVRVEIRDNCNAAKVHWKNVGFRKSYDATPDTNLADRLKNFDCYSYIARYPEIREAIGVNCTLAKEHFYEQGFDEGKIAAIDPLLHTRFEDFDCYSYLGRYVELRKVYQYDCNAAARQWLSQGIKNGLDASEGPEKKFMVFDCDSYYARYQSIRKTISYDCKALEKNWLEKGIKEGKDCSADPKLVAEFKDFDCNSYFVRYLQVRQECGYDCVKLQKNWYTAGFAEGRNASFDARLNAIPTTFDCASYQMRYKDARKACKGDCNAAKNHWAGLLVKEARDATPDAQLIKQYNDFDCLSYAARYLDVRKQFGLDCTKIKQHWVEIGIDERRNAAADAAISKPYRNYDCFSYLVRYADVRKSFGDDCTAVKKHWDTIGVIEGRDASFDIALNEKISKFNCTSYLAKYADAKKTCKTCKLALQHFIKIGISEGRTY